MSDKLSVRVMSREEIRDTYNIWMTKQFYPDELKPLAHIEKLLTKEKYRAYGLWNGATFVAYALFCMAKANSALLLDYYAVLPHFQDKGYGGKFLELLVKELKDWEDIILEVENPDFAENDKERDICQRRLRFYERNACEYTDAQVKLFGHEYVIMLLPAARRASNSEVVEQLDEIYHTMFSSEIYKKNIIMRRVSWEAAK